MLRPLLEIPLDHPIYNLHFKFPNGLPKIHQHDGLPPKALGIFHQLRIAETAFRQKAKIAAL